MTQAAFFISDSISKNIFRKGDEIPEITEENIMHLANDAILQKRIESQMQWKVELMFKKEKGEINLNPLPEQWL